VKNARSYPGADVDSNHNLVAMKCSVRMKKLQKTRRQKKWDMENLRRKGDLS